MVKKAVDLERIKKIKKEVFDYQGVKEENPITI